MPNVGMVSLGCAKNRVDAEVMLGLLKREGFTLVSDPEQADAIIVNTCGFIQPAKEESIDAILDMARHKQGRCKALIVSGCLSKRYGEELEAEMPEVDAFLGIGEYGQIASVVRDCLAGKRLRRTKAPFGFVEQVDRVLTTPEYSAYVKIADGCDNRCAYCAIPLIRGGYVSRPVQAIVEEARRLAERGVKEITLIAQDTTRYGLDLYGQSRLAELMERVAEVEGVHWVRTLYCYPDLIDDRLLELMHDHPKICAYLDIPLQHVEDKVLRDMNRRGDHQLIDRLYHRIRQMGGFALRTTMIAGFPGESEQQFAFLMEYLRTHPFDRLGAFAYSEEEGTPAAQRAGQVPLEERKRREDAIMRQQKAISRAFNQSRVGSTVEVLVEGYTKEGLAYGRSAWEAPEIDGSVLVKQFGDAQPGQFITVEITGAMDYDVLGVRKP